jgi:hypothetical protein
MTLIRETLEAGVLREIAKMQDDVTYKLHKGGEPVVGTIKFPMKGRLWKKLIEREVPEKTQTANITMEQMKKMGLPGLTRGSNETAKKKKRK